jgi:hypothetical protein
MALTIREWAWYRTPSNWRLLVLGIPIILAAVLAPTAVHAITPLSQGYTSKDALAFGSIVSLEDTASDVVHATTSTTAGNMLGVVINDRNTLLSLDNGNASQVQVATSGVVSVLVSNINGEVRAGDEITASPIRGVGMKATSNTKVIGISQGDLKGNTASKETYTDKAGKKHDVLMGTVPLQVNVAYYYKQPDKTLVPSAIQNIANAMAGKAVNTLPIMISGAIFIVMMIVVSSIVYSMVRSSIISVGRNPMSQSAIYRDMVQMSALVVGILGVGVVSIYLVLTRL